MGTWPPSHWIVGSLAGGAAGAGVAPKTDPKNPYRTPLAPNDEAAFQTWVADNRVPFDPAPTADYDMRGFWQGLQAKDPRATTAVNPSDKQLHFPDVWKTPYHKTFSNESMYAPKDAPRWIGTKLVDKTGKVIADESVPEE